MFRRRRRTATTTTTDEQPTPEQLPLDAREPELAPEPAVVQATAAQPIDALLTAVLDDLGSAHHRPFSRG